MYRTVFPSYDKRISEINFKKSLCLLTCLFFNLKITSRPLYLVYLVSKSYKIRRHFTKLFNNKKVEEIVRLSHAFLNSLGFSDCYQRSLSLTVHRHFLHPPELPHTGILSCTITTILEHTLQDRSAFQHPYSPKSPLQTSQPS